jgi:hypothetical protein
MQLVQHCLKMQLLSVVWPAGVLQQLPAGTAIPEGGQWCVCRAVLCCAVLCCGVLLCFLCCPTYVHEQAVVITPLACRLLLLPAHTHARVCAGFQLVYASNVAAAAAVHVLCIQSHPLSLVAAACTCACVCVCAGFQPVYASNVAADVALTARPRYHIAGGQALFYARVPYSNPDLGAGQRATRFVGLGSVTGKTPYPETSPGAASAAESAAGGGGGRAGIGSSSAAQQQQQQQGVVGPAGPAGKAQPAQKFLHALGLPPASTLSTDVLSSLPDGCGGCPYQMPGQGSKKRPADEVRFESTIPQSLVLCCSPHRKVPL